MRALLDHPFSRSLSSIRLGIVLGFSAAAVLALSSLTIPDPRRGEPLPFSESFEPFLASFQLRYAWFWLLAALLAVLAVNLLTSTLRSALLRRRGTWDLRFSGIVLMHVSVVLGLVTHLAAGLSARVEQSVLLTREATPVAGHSLALLDVKPQRNPDGTLRTVEAFVSVDGARRRLAHNEPLFFDGMRRFVLLQELRAVAGAAVFSVGGQRESAMPGEAFGPPGARWVLGRISAHPSLRVPMVLARPADAPDAWKWVAAGQELAPGIELEGVMPASALVIMVRRNDGIPVLLVASAVFALGLVLFVIGRRRIAARPSA